MNNGSAFFTYCSENQTIIDQLLRDLYPAKIEIIKDTRSPEDRNKMVRQMRVEKDSPIFLLLSDQFLKSEESMGELLSFFQDTSIASRIFPVLLAEVKNPDGSFTHTSISQEEDLIRYKAYWDEIYWSLRKQKDQVPSTELGSYSWRVREVRHISSEVESIFTEILKYDVLTLYQFKQDNYSALLDKMGAGGEVAQSLMDIHYQTHFPETPEPETVESDTPEQEENKVSEAVEEIQETPQESMDVSSNAENAYLNYLTEVQNEIKESIEDTEEVVANAYPNPEDKDPTINYEVTDLEMEPPSSSENENELSSDQPEPYLPEGLSQEEEETNNLIESVTEDLVEQLNQAALITEEEALESHDELIESEDQLEEEFTLSDEFADIPDSPEEFLDELVENEAEEEEGEELPIINAPQLPMEMPEPEEDDHEIDIEGDDDDHDFEEELLLPLYDSATMAMKADKDPFGRGLVLVTGATSGIGKSCAELFAQNGYSLIITGRRKKRLKSFRKHLKKTYGVKVKSLAFDIRKMEAVSAALDSLPDKWLAIDILINNAGLAKGLAPIHEGQLEHWETMIDTNLKGLLYITRLVSPLMVKRGKGHIVNIGSVAGKEVYPNGNVYNATKHALDALTKGMRIDLYKHNIRVSAVHPGHVETEFAIVRFDGDEQRARIYEDFQPLTALDVAETVYFIASRPPHVNIQDVLIFSTQQGSATLVNRDGR
ncbi:MAG: SDR family NAD(P)-dependent oxidoreductase [Bacteroidota bacterium]